MILGIVLPILRLVGYDISNPKEILPQSRDQNGKRTDLQLYHRSALVEGEVKQVIEVKTLNEKLDNWIGQVGQYFMGNSSNWYALTNGYEWRIYDSHSTNSQPKFWRTTITLKEKGAIEALYHILGKDMDTPDIERAAQIIVDGNLENAAQMTEWKRHLIVWEENRQLVRSLSDVITNLKTKFPSQNDRIES